MDYKAQDIINAITQLGILPDAVTAKTTGDWGGLAYIIGCAIGSRAPVKFGLLFAVGDLLEPQRN